MKQSKNMLSDWLAKHGDPEIDKLVEQQAREIMAQYNIEYQYLDLLQDILDNGVEKKDRTGTGTISVFGRQIRHKMSEGFPLLTTKKMAFKTMVTELLWFLRGDTNIKFLIENGCHIWDGDAYKKYCESVPHQHPHFLSKEQFINTIKTNGEFADEWGDLGPVYGKQWTDWNVKVPHKTMGGVYHTRSIDQIQNLINELKTNPDSRRLMVNAWNVGELDKMVLPPCHYGFQVYTRELSESERFSWYGNKIGSHMHHDHIEQEMNENNVPTRAISLMWNQRSCDFPLGIPFNIASYGLLLEILAKEVNMVPDELIGNLGDCHIYLNQIEGCKEQIGREPFELPKLIINNEFWNPDDSMLSIEQVKHMELDDFILDGYQSHPAIKAPLSN